MRWYFIITDEMRALGLTGSELLVFAVVAGFSQNGQGCFYGSTAYLAEVCGITTRTAREALHALADRGLLRKIDVYENNVHLCRYEVVGGGEKISLPGKKFPGGGEKISPNNKDNNTPYVSFKDKSLKDTAPQGAVSQKDILRKFVALGCDESVLADWVAARKGAKVTASVLEGMQREADKAGISLAEAVRICAENSWRGFRADYLRKDHGTPAPKKQRSIMDGMKQVAASLWGTDPFGNPLPPDEIERRKRL